MSPTQLLKRNGTIVDPSMLDYVRMLPSVTWAAIKAMMFGIMLTMSMMLFFCAIVGAVIAVYKGVPALVAFERDLYKRMRERKTGLSTAELEEMDALNEEGTRRRRGSGDSETLFEEGSAREEK
ncbi:MAG: hypothetical protein Q9163_001272 [Psora crenata]